MNLDWQINLLIMVMNIQNMCAFTILATKRLAGLPIIQSRRYLFNEYIDDQLRQLFFHVKNNTTALISNSVPNPLRFHK